MKTKMTVLILSLSLSVLGLLQAQIKPDFVLVPGGFDPHSALDANGNLHVTTGSVDDGIYYDNIDLE